MYTINKNSETSVSCKNPPERQVKNGTFPATHDYTGPGKHLSPPMKIVFEIRKYLPAFKSYQKDERQRYRSINIKKTCA